MKGYNKMTRMLLITLCVVTVAKAQTEVSIADTSGIDFQNIFNSSGTDIGIPTKSKVFIYAPQPSDPTGGWTRIDSLNIPNGMKAADGNIRKLIFLTGHSVIFKEYDRYDTLTFNQVLQPINPRLWIRGPYSTEAESYFLSGEKNTCYYRQYDEDSDQFKWHISDKMNPRLFRADHTQPLLTDQDGFSKLYTFQSGKGGEYIAAIYKNRITFHKYELIYEIFNKESPDPLTMTLPDGTITAFVYDQQYIAIVSKTRIRFYRFDKELKKWAEHDGIKPLSMDNL